MRDVQEPSEPSTPIDKGIQSDLGGIAQLKPESSTSSTLTTMVPKQPVLPEYPGTKFSSESFTRRFQPDWYKKYPWLSYDVEKDVCVCFAYTEFGKDASFVFKNWKKPSKLTKHSQSENHTCHGCSQNSTDAQLQFHAQWTSPTIQNELLAIVSDLVLERITTEVRKSGYFGIIMDETSDISRTEEVSLCLSSDSSEDSSDEDDLDTLLIFSMFPDNKSDFTMKNFEDLTNFECEKMFEKDDMYRLLDALDIPEYYISCQRTNTPGMEALMILLQKIVDDIYDRFGHLLDSLDLSWLDPAFFAEVIHNKGAPLEHCWGFIDGTPRPMARPSRNQHIMFSGHKRVHCIKFQSVQAPNGLIANMFGPIEDKRHDAFMLGKKRTYTNQSHTKDRRKIFVRRRSILSLHAGAVSDTGFPGLILSNTDNLSRYLQGEQMDVITAKKTTDAVVKTLSNCRNEESFTQMLSHADVIAQKIRIGIEGKTFTFRDAKVPRTRLSHRLQSLTGETPAAANDSSQQTAKDHFRITVYYTSIDKVVSELQSSLMAMTRRFCADWAKLYSAILQASTQSKLYQISMTWIMNAVK
ncbi:hypothetical protein AWC38_SpisGene2011 [Stylophora pistillata]|uniref:TTF-type domain-containing protein n=1 Tax=Stylophora pistillata TaxID=50429 RepID=A0A2B4SUR7_STYPI|nr:hypothetical protein AWC38_SpisGene2011 [Stylophora pistillata]